MLYSRIRIVKEWIVGQLLYSGFSFVKEWIEG